jgi:hypothetical protein
LKPACISVVDGHAGHQVEIHGIAERFIDPRAIEINRQPLWGSLFLAG